jgi:hypothetical protein
MSSIQVRRDINWNVHLDTRRNGRNGQVSIGLESRYNFEPKLFCQWIVIQVCSYRPPKNERKLEQIFWLLMRTSDEKTVFVSTRAKSID